MELMHYFLQINFSTIIIAFFMLIFVIANPVFERRIVNMFSTAAIMILFLVFIDSIEYWCASLSHPIMLRVIVSILGYFLRPAIIFLNLILLCRNNVKRNTYILMALPMIINGLIVFTALFSNIAFSYSEDNKFIRGPLGYAPFLASGIYLLLIVIMTKKLFKGENKNESLIAIAIAVISSLAAVLESAFNYDGFINIAGAASMAFYYMYLTTQQFKHDPLTGALNRRNFYIDGEKNFQYLTAIISIDLNNLKTINDKLGHAEGDRAICTLTKCVHSSLLNGCFLYRTGGDEFMILCFRQKKCNIPDMIKNIKLEMKKTPYSCAIGTVFLESDIDFKQACSLADAAMYENKRLLKNKKNH